MYAHMHTHDVTIAAQKRWEDIWKIERLKREREKRKSEIKANCVL